MNKEQEVIEKLKIVFEMVVCPHATYVDGCDFCKRTRLLEQAIALLKQPVNSPPEAKEKTAPIIKPETGVEKGEVVSQQSVSEFTKECRETELDEWSDWRIKEICDRLDKAIDKLEALRDTVQISCNPPKDCNDPVVLKTYMKGCFDEAMKL